MTLRNRISAVDLPAFALSGLSVALIAFAHGGYFPEAWGWAGMALCLCCVCAVMLRGSFEVSLWLAWLAICIAAILAWAAISLWWTADVAGGVQSVQRDGLYLSLVLAAAAVAGRRSRVPLIAGTATAIVLVSTYAVATRLFPDRLGTFTDPQGPGRLYTPVGYWNGAAELSAIGLGIVMCACLYVTSQRLRMTLAATVPVLALAVFFTYSRGPLVALAAGFLVTVALEPRRASLLAWLIGLAIVPALLVAEAASLHWLSGAGYGRSAAGQGHRLAVLLVVACGLRRARMGHVAARGAGSREPAAADVGFCARSRSRVSPRPPSWSSWPRQAERCTGSSARFTPRAPRPGRRRASRASPRMRGSRSGRSPGMRPDAIRLPGRGRGQLRDRVA